MLDIRNLTKTFGNRTVLDSIDLHVDSGEVVAVIGPSGTGKSTLLRCVNFLETPDRGRIEIDGAAVDSARPDKDEILRLRRSSAMVFQHYNLFRNRNALENVMEALLVVRRMPEDLAREKAERMLKEVGLAEKKTAYPFSLSGGEQQRVGIARAIALEPEILLLDEPTSALDPELVGEVLAVIGKLAQRHMTMLLVTHEMAFARSAASRVIFLEGGHIVEDGEPAVVLEKPHNPRTAQFLKRFLR